MLPIVGRQCRCCARDAGIVEQQVGILPLKYCTAVALATVCQPLMCS